MTTKTTSFRRDRWTQDPEREAHGQKGGERTSIDKVVEAATRKYGPQNGYAMPELIDKDPETKLYVGMSVTPEDGTSGRRRVWIVNGGKPIEIYSTTENIHRPHIAEESGKHYLKAFIPTPDNLEGEKELYQEYQVPIKNWKKAVAQATGDTYLARGQKMMKRLLGKLAA
ncbi:hypothetical protein DRQ25_14815 [Candidatus Fermentibacteria bacterium]|nr:MAG: hypothetical protein DRQ25_14815 [Candidatus Fermentibacteria bacterium]